MRLIIDHHSYRLWLIADFHGSILQIFFHYTHTYIYTHIWPHPVCLGHTCVSGQMKDALITWSVSLQVEPMKGSGPHAHTDPQTRADRSDHQNRFVPVRKTPLSLQKEMKPPVCLCLYSDLAQLGSVRISLLGFGSAWSGISFAASIRIQQLVSGTGSETAQGWSWAPFLCSWITLSSWGNHFRKTLSK